MTAPTHFSSPRTTGTDRPCPQLKFFAGLWTLRRYPTPKSEWTVRRKFEEARGNGFEAIGGRFVPEAPALCRELGLEYILYIDADGSNFEEQFRRAVDFNPRRVNIQLGDHDTPVDVAVAAWAAMVECAEKLHLTIDLELHRGTATETPEKACAIADAFRAHTGRPARFCLDYSHFAVVKHLQPPYAPELLQRRDLLTGARQLHLRPFNGHHAQVPATDGKGAITRDCEVYLEFVAVLFDALLDTARADEVFYACPENGPAGCGDYALSCFPDVWNDAVRVRDEVRRLWTVSVARRAAAWGETPS